MSTTAQFRLTVPVPVTRARMPVAADEQVINLTLETDDKLLLTVVEAAHRLGIGRTLMYELLGTGRIESVHVGRDLVEPADALERFVEHCRSDA